MKSKILMVCLGNICRSPLAEGILKSKLDPEKFEVHSCGTSAFHLGEKPDSRSIEVAKKYGIDISQQKADQFKISYFDRFEHIYVMDHSNYQNVTKLARNNHDKQKVQLILETVFKNNLVEVPDPYYGGEQGFEDVYQMLDQASDHIAQKLKNLKQNTQKL